jgi:hypothetical protein
MVSRWAFLILAVLLVASASAYDEKDRTAALATTMLNQTSGDYQMVCGPGREVLPTLPSPLKGDYFCVLNDGEITFGTFLPAGNNAASSVLLMINNTIFSNQIENVNLAACNSNGTGSFAICPNAIKSKHTTLYTYIYIDGSDSTTYIIISERSLTKLEGNYGIISKITDYFRRLFGL